MQLVDQHSRDGEVQTTEELEKPYIENWELGLKIDGKFLLFFSEYKKQG